MREKGEVDDNGHHHRPSGRLGPFEVEVSHIVARRTEIVMLSFQTSGKPPL